MNGYHIPVLDFTDKNIQLFIEYDSSFSSIMHFTYYAEVNFLIC